MRNGQKDFFIKWQNFPHSDSTWELQENISPIKIIAPYFNESSDKRTSCNTSVCANVQFVRQNYHGTKEFRSWKIFYQSLLTRFILTAMFTDVNLGANVIPDFEPQNVQKSLFCPPDILKSQLLATTEISFAKA